MRISTGGSTPWRFFLTQAAILLAIIIFLKFYLPHRSREMAKSRVIEREQKITGFYEDWVETDSAHEAAVPLDGSTIKGHPQKLRALCSPQEAESTLGIADSTTTDVRGGQHLAWIGATHKLEAAFNQGRLYCLTYEDRSTGHGVLVYDSFEMWHPY